MKVKPMKVIRSPQVDVTIDGQRAQLAMVSKNGDGIAMMCWFAFRLIGHGWQCFDVRQLGAVESEWYQRWKENGPAILVDVSHLVTGRSMADLTPHLLPL